MEQNGKRSKEPSTKKEDKFDRVVGDMKERGRVLLNEGWENARQVFEEKADRVKKKVGEVGDKSMEELTDDVKFYVRRHPLGSMGIALGLGFLIGSFFRSDN